MRRSVALAFALSLCACMSTGVEHYLVGSPSIPRASPVRIVMQGQPTPSGLTEIAVIQGHGRSMPDVLNAMQGDAQTLGCTLLVNVRVDQGSVVAINGVCAVEATAFQAAAIASAPPLAPGSTAEAPLPPAP